MFDVPGQTPTPLADATYYDFRTTPISCKQPFLATGRGHYQLTELYGSRTVESANGHPAVPRFLFSTPPPTGARTRGSPRADQRDGCPDVRLYHFGEVCHAALSGSNVFACHMTSEAFKTPASCVQDSCVRPSRVDTTDSAMTRADKSHTPCANALQRGQRCHIHAELIMLLDDTCPLIYERSIPTATPAPSGGTEQASTPVEQSTATDHLLMRHVLQPFRRT